MKKLDQRSGYLKLGTLVISILLILFGCAIKRVSQSTSFELSKGEFFFDSIRKVDLPIKKLEIEKAKIRIDYGGQLRTLKTYLAVDVDSFLYLKITTPIGIEVANFLAFPQFILLIDNPEKTVYKSDYNSLSIKLGFPITFNDIVRIFLGFPSHLNMAEVSDVKSTKSDTNLNTFFIELFYNYNKDTFITKYSNVYEYSFPLYCFLSSEIVNNENSSLISSQYTRKPEFSSILPQRVFFSFQFNEKPIEVELNYRSFKFDGEVSYRVDSTFQSKKL
jgi:hypothetical protein